MDDPDPGDPVQPIARLLHVGVVPLLGDAEGRDQLARLVIAAPENQTHQVDHERVSDQEGFEVGRSPASAGDHRLLESFGLELGHLADLLLEPLPVLDGRRRLGRVVLGTGLGQVVLQLAGLVADHRFHPAPECEPELAGPEVEQAAAAVVEVAVGYDAVLQLGAGESAVPGDPFHELALPWP